MAIRQILDCDANPLGVVDLHVSRRNGEEWNGTVHVFEIGGHPRASRCYAWPEPLDETSVAGTGGALHPQSPSTEVGPGVPYGNGCTLWRAVLQCVLGAFDHVGRGGEDPFRQGLQFLA
jgi:hypothetical protein